SCLQWSVMTGGFSCTVAHAWTVYAAGFGCASAVPATPVKKSRNRSETDFIGLGLKKLWTCHFHRPYAIHRFDEFAISFLDGGSADLERRGHHTVFHRKCFGQDHKAAHPFETRDPRLQAFEFRFDRPSNRFARRQIVIGDLAGSTQPGFAHRRKIGNDKRGAERAFVTDEHNLIDQTRFGKKRFNGGGRDILASARYEKVLFTVGDRYISFPVDLADVSGMQPSFLIDHLAGRIGMLIIPLHDVRPARENFAIRGDPDLDVHERKANASPSQFFIRIGTEDRRGFGETVALDDRKPERGKRAADLGRKRRRPGNKKPDASARPRSNVPEYQKVRNGPEQPRKDRNSFPFHRAAVLGTDRERPIEEPAFYRRHFFAHAHNPPIDTLIKTRDAGHDRRTNFE